MVKVTLWASLCLCKHGEHLKKMLDLKKKSCSYCCTGGWRSLLFLAQYDKLDIIVKPSQITCKSSECMSNKPGSLICQTMLSLFPRSAVVSKRLSGTLLQEADAAQLMPLPLLELPGWPYLSSVDLNCQCTLLLAPVSLKYFLDVSTAQGIKLIV